MTAEAMAAAGGGKLRWCAAAAGGLIAALAVVSIFRAPPVLEPIETAAARGVEMRHVGAEEGVLGEETILRDLTPLFLPTERNASLRRLPVREPGQSVLDLEAPKLGMAISGWRFNDRLPPVITLQGRALAEVTPLAALQAITPDPAVPGFGRAPATVAPMQPRGGLIQIVRASDGSRLPPVVLDPEARPNTDQVWQPLEFLVKVGPAGLVAPPTITTRSGVEEVDVFYRNYLARIFRIGERLRPGFYRITVAP